MAVWAKWMLFAAMVSTGVTTAGVVYVALTLQVSRHAVQAAIKAAEAAQRSNDIAERAMIGLERPLPMIELNSSVTIAKGRGIDLDMAPEVVNLGRTPCILTSYQLQIRQYDSNYRFPQIQSYVHAMVLNKDERRPLSDPIDYRDSKNYSDKDVEGALRDGTNLYCFGKLTYRDFQTLSG